MVRHAYTYERKTKIQRQKNCIYSSILSFSFKMELFKERKEKTDSFSSVYI